MYNTVIVLISLYFDFTYFEIYGTLTHNTLKTHKVQYRT